MFSKNTSNNEVEFTPSIVEQLLVVQYNNIKEI